MNLCYVVPSEKELDILTRFKEFKCKISDMLATIEKSDLMVGCTDMVSQVWVLVCGFPYWARKEKVVEEVSYLVGDFVEVDPKSLPGLGPIRLKVSCKDTSSIKGSSMVYFNGRGFSSAGTWRMRRMRGSQFTWTSQDRRKMMWNHGKMRRKTSDNYTPFGDGPGK